MNFEYYSSSLIGPIEYGMNRGSVRQVFHSPYEEFRKSEFSSNTTDAFDLLGVHVYYDSDDVVKGIEIFSDTGQLTYMGLELLGRSFSSLLNQLLAKNIGFEENSLGVNLEGDRIRLYSPEKNGATGGEVRSVYVKLSSET